MKYLVCEVEHYGLTEKYGSSAFKIGYFGVNSIALNQNGWTRQHVAHHYSYYSPSYQDFERHPLVLIPVPHQKDLEEIAIEITKNKQHLGCTTDHNSGHNHRWSYIDRLNLVHIDTFTTGSSYLFYFEWDQQEKLSFILENPYPDFIIDLPETCDIAKKRQYFWDLELNIHQPNEQGLTLLHQASSSLSRAGVQELLKSGADTNVQDRNGKTPLILAAEAINSKVKRTGQEYAFYDLNKIPPEKAADVFRYLLKFGVNVNIKDNYGRTALHYLALQPHLIFVNILLKQDPKLVTIKDNQSDTPFDLALNFSTPEVVKQLQFKSLVGTIVERRLITMTIFGRIIKESRDYVWICQLKRSIVSGDIQIGSAVPSSSSDGTIIRLKKMADGRFKQESKYIWYIWDGSPRHHWTD